MLSLILKDKNEVKYVAFSFSTYPNNQHIIKLNSKGSIYIQKYIFKNLFSKWNINKYIF